MLGIPIALRVIYRDKFTRGPFHLGKYSYIVALGAITWIAFISIVFILPQINVSHEVSTRFSGFLSFSRKPVNSQTLNYAIVAVAIVVVYSTGFWLLSARKWFTGPIKQIEGKNPSVRFISHV
jgi:hypothetical protein